MHEQPAPATPRNAKARAAERAKRLGQAAEWLRAGMRPRTAVTKGIATWGVRKRMAQIYVATARRLHAESQSRNHTRDMQEVQNQRLEAIQALNATLHNPVATVDERRSLASCSSQLRGLISDYEKTALRTQERSTSAAAGDDYLRLRLLHDQLKQMEEKDATNETADAAAPRQASVANQAAPQSAPVPATAKPVPAVAKLPIVEVEKTPAPIARSTLGQAFSDVRATPGAPMRSEAKAQREHSDTIAASDCRIIPLDSNQKSALRSPPQPGCAISPARASGS